jgi:hypothetical protein
MEQRSRQNFEQETDYDWQTFPFISQQQCLLELAKGNELKFLLSFVNLIAAL